MSSRRDEILAAAARGDRETFTSLARSLPGGLEEARAIVRAGPVTRVGGTCQISDNAPKRNGNGKVQVRSRGPSGLPELRSSGPTFTVHLSAGAQSAIEEEIRDARQQMGDVETGGNLYSLYRPGHDLLGRAVGDEEMRVRFHDGVVSTQAGAALDRSLHVSRRERLPGDDDLVVSELAGGAQSGHVTFLRSSRAQ